MIPISKSWHRRKTFVVSIALLLAGTVWLSSCSNGKDKAAGAMKGGQRTVPVAVATAVIKAVPVELSTFGTVEPSASVSVKSEVTGTVVAVHFEKGQMLKKDQILFEVDPRTFTAAVAQSKAAVAQAEAAVAQAKGTLARDKAQEQNLRKSLERQGDLLGKKWASQAEYDKAQADADAAVATLAGDEAAIRAADATVLSRQADLRNAELQLEHCTIRSPIDGRAGDVLLDAGNVVKAEDLPMVTINQISPIDVFFSINQNVLPQIKQYMAQGKLAVRATFPQEEGEPEVGELTFVDNAVDLASRTIKIGATFANKRERLWPGQYVNVTLLLTVEKDSIVVPAKAVQSGREGKYVFVVKSDNTVEIRYVTVGSLSGDDVVIVKDLASGERVVTDGQFQLTSGSVIAIKGEVPQGKVVQTADPAKDGPAQPDAGKRAGS